MPTITEYYDGSFDGVSFQELWTDGDGFAEPDEVEVYTVRHVPGSNTNELTTDGLDSAVFEIRVGMSASDRSSIRSKRGNSATLACHAGSITATLVGITRIRWVPGHNIYNLTLRFVV